MRLGFGVPYFNAFFLKEPLWKNILYFFLPGYLRAQEMQVFFAFLLGYFKAQYDLGTAPTQ